MADTTIKFETKFNAVELNKGLSDANKKMDSFVKSGSKLNTVNAQMKSLTKTVFRLGAALQVGKFLKDAIKIGSDVAEIANVVNVTFGSMSDTIEQFAQSSMKNFGLSELSAKKYASTMGSMLKSSGITGDTMVDMSMDLAKLTADMASFHNLENDEMFGKLMSGMSGMAMPLKQLGINMNIANLEAYALSQGITKSYQAMTQAEQTMLRYNYIMSVTGDMQGDFSRNAHNWAHQLKILSSQMSTFMSILGQGMINVIAPVVRALNVLMAKLIQVAQVFKTFTAGIFGDTQASKATATDLGYIGNSLGGIGDGFGGVSDKANKAAKGVKKANKELKETQKNLQGFDIINKMQKENKGSGGGAGLDGLDDLGGLGAGGLGDISMPTLAIDDIEVNESAIAQKMADVARRFTNVFKEAWEQEGKNTINAIKQAFTSILELIKVIGATFMKIWESDVGVKILSTILKIIQNISLFVSAIADNLARTWEESGLGESIFRNIGEIIAWILEIVEKLTGKMVEWAKELDFEPILKAIDGLFQKVLDNMPRIEALVDRLWENVLKPFGTWLIESFLPQWVELKGAIFELALTLLEEFAPTIENLVPIITDFADGAMKRLLAIIEGVSQFIKDHPGVLAEIVKILLKIVATFKLFSVVKGFFTMVSGGITGMLTNADLAVASIMKWGGKIASGVFKFDMMITGAIKSVVASVGLMPIAIGAALIVLLVLIVKNWDKIKEVTLALWEAIKEIFSNAIEGIKGFMEGMQEKVQAVFTAIGEFINTHFIERWKAGFEAAKQAITNFKENVSEVFERVKEIFNTIITFVTSTFKEGWTNAWNGIKDILKGIMDLMINVVKTPINTIIGMFNKMLEAVHNAVSLVAKAINAISFDIPDWIPKIGGKSFGFDIQLGPPPKIPMLAKGGLIPPRKPRPVIVGDNMHEDEIVSPVSTMKEAFRDVLSELDELGAFGRDTGNDELILLMKQLVKLMEKGQVIEMNGREFGRAVQESAKEMKMKTGKSFA